MNKIYSIQDKQIIEIPFTVEQLELISNKKAEWSAGANDRAASALRTERNAKLAESDWTQVVDAPVNQAAWATYRQALRDIPEQAGFPETVVWPVKP